MARWAGRPEGGAVNILIFGAGGTLARAINRMADSDHIITITHAEVDISDLGQVRNSLMRLTPDVVINAAGYLPERCVAEPLAAVLANTLGPHVLAVVCNALGIRLVHVSTDCVFGGRNLNPRPRTVDAGPSPTTFYGRLKLAGEPETAGRNIAVVRTSFVDPEAGLWKWLEEEQSNAPLVAGWAHAWWSGSTSDEVADGLLAIARSDFTGIAHLATAKPINKAVLLRRLSERSGWNPRRVVAMPHGEDRSLHPTHVLPPILVNYVQPAPVGKP